MKYVALVVAVGLVGCGGDDGGESRAIDDFVPPEVVATYPDRLDVDVTCIRAHYASIHRVLDCTNDPAVAANAEWQLAEVNIADEWCGRNPGYQPTAADYEQQDVLEACFDTWVYGSCSDLTVGTCRLSDGWVPPQP